MQLVNSTNLPRALAAAVEADPYTRQSEGFTATELIAPAHQRALQIKHDSEIVEDVSERIWALIGNNTHAIVERAAIGLGAPCANVRAEQRLQSVYKGHVVSGQYDLAEEVRPHKWVIYDFKVTSVWAVLNGCKDEWVQQMNILGDLWRRNAEHRDDDVVGLQIVAILRDWSKAKAREDAAKGGNYPQSQVVTFDIPVWDALKVEGFVWGRIDQHVEQRLAVLEDGGGEPCAPAERWDTPTVYAVKKKGNKNAVRGGLKDTAEEAWEMAAALGGKGPHYVEERPGTSKRCLDYCNVARWCSHGQEILK